MLQILFLLGCLSCTVWKSCAQTTPLVSITRNESIFTIVKDSEKILLEVKRGSITQLKGVIGTNITTLVPCTGVTNCFSLNNGSNRLHVTSNIDDGITLHWMSTDQNTVFKDCFELGEYQWYGGPERFHQHWPIQKLQLDNFANVLQELEFGAVAEPYWLNSAGAYIYVDERVPLFIDQNTNDSKAKVCFTARNSQPYPDRNKVTLQYSIVSKENPREAHLHAVNHLLGKPTGHPNSKIIQKPIWSTWARYKRNITADLLTTFLKEIVDNGYTGQFEIDDDWEDCYGALTIRKSKFPDMAKTVSSIKDENFTVTLWVHPFVNVNCSQYTDIGRTYGYFVKNKEGSVLTKWWNSDKDDAQYLDFTKAEVRNWFTERLKKLKDDYGFDGFKFDAGETSWTPQVPVLEGDNDRKPNNIAEDYARTCAAFGDLVEIRVGWRTQDLPVFVRMIDKDSTWGTNNGLYTLITTLLQMNLNGYTMVLPDMVGGNGYNGAPSAELFVRWLQANVFMPSIQFSYVPWDYSNNKINVLDISKRFVTLHEKFTNYILTQMKRSIESGYPVNAPIWWVDPANSAALSVDTEFLLGEDVLVAPIITEGATSRTIIFPNGTWVDGNTREVYTGPKQIDNYNAPIEVLPYFIRQGSEIDADDYYIGSGNSMITNTVLLVLVCTLRLII